MACKLTGLAEVRKCVEQEMRSNRTALCEFLEVLSEEAHRISKSKSAVKKQEAREWRRAARELEKTSGYCLRKWPVFY